MLIRFALALVSLVAVSGVAVADQLRRADLPAEAGLVVHVDVEAWCENPVATAIAEQLLVGEFMRGQLQSLPDDVQAMIHTRPDDVTYVGEPHEGSATLIVTVEGAEQLVDVVRRSSTHVQLAYGRFAIHHWVADLHAMSGLFSHPPHGENRRKGEDRELELYLLIWDNQRLVVSNRMRHLADWIERQSDPGRAMPITEFEARFGAHDSRSIVLFDHAPPAVDSGSTNDAQTPRLTAGRLWADDSLHVETTLDLGSDTIARVVEEMARPQHLTGYLQSMHFGQPGADNNGVDNNPAENSAVDNNAVDSNAGESDDTRPASRSTTPAAGEHSGNLSFGVGFRGLNPPAFDESEVQSFLEDTLEVNRHGSQLRVHWSGHAQLRYEYRFEQGIDHHSFKAWLAATAEELERIASHDTDRVDR